MQKLVNLSIIFIAVVILVFLLKEFQSFLRPFAIAIILTLVLTQILRHTDKLKIPKSVTIILLFLILITVVYLLAFFITKESSKLNDNIPVYSQTIRDNVDLITTHTPISVKDIDKLYDSNQLTVYAKNFLQGMISLLSELFVALIFTIFLVPSHRKLIRNIESEISKHGARKFRSALNHIEKSIRDYIYTKAVISLGTAFVSLAVLYIFKSDFIFILAVLIFILNFIPNIGSIIAVFIAEILYLLKFGLSFQAFWLLVILIVIQVIFGNILEPKFAGDKLKLSPIVILLSLFIWFYIWGIIGMMLAIPLTSILKIILEHIKKTKKIGDFLG